MVKLDESGPGAGGGRRTGGGGRTRGVSSRNKQRSQVSTSSLSSSTTSSRPPRNREGSSASLDVSLLGDSTVIGAKEDLNSLFRIVAQRWYDVLRLRQVRRECHVCPVNRSAVTSPWQMRGRTHTAVEIKELGNEVEVRDEWRSSELNQVVII